MGASSITPPCPGSKSKLAVEITQKGDAPSRHGRRLSASLLPLIPSPVGASGQNRFVEYCDISLVILSQEKAVNRAAEMLSSGVQNVVVEHAHKNGMVAVSRNLDERAETSHVLHLHFGEIEVKNRKFFLEIGINWQGIYPTRPERNAPYEPRCLS